MNFKDMPYERVDFDRVKKEMDEIMEEFDAAKNGEEQFEVHKKYYALSDRVSTLYTIAHIRYDIDTSDEFYEKEHEYYDEMLPMFESMALKYARKLYQSPYRE